MQSTEVKAEKPSIVWWLSEAGTMFVNGFIAGFLPGLAVGGTAAASSDTMDPQQLTTQAAIGFVLAAASNGVKRVVVWHDKNPFPNPFAWSASVSPINPSHEKTPPA
jgi:hypothetical protein